MKQPNTNSAKRFVRPVTYGIISGAAACFVLLILISIVMGLQDVPQPAVYLIAVLTFIIGGFIGGYVCAMLSRERGMQLGLCCGFCLFFLLMLASLAVDGRGFGLVALTKLAAVLLASALGGIVGVNTKRKFKYAKSAKK